jgi:hypothetical protein
MGGLSATWTLHVLVAYSRRWSTGVAREFESDTSTVLERLVQRLRVTHPALRVTAHFLAVNGQQSPQLDLLIPFAVAILDVTDYDEHLALLAGLLIGRGTPCIYLCRGPRESVPSGLALTEDPILAYDSFDSLCAPDGPLLYELAQAVSLTRVLQELIYQIWFPRDTKAIWVVCPQINEPGEFADRTSADYTYLDNLGDTDALLENMVFLSRLYPKAVIEHFSSHDLPRGHSTNNLVVIGGPGSAEDIGNVLCQQMMSLMKSAVSYSADCERMSVQSLCGEVVTLTSDLLGSLAGNRGALRHDHGYFGRFPNPLNNNSAVVLINGIHTPGVLGAARAFTDRNESLRNFHTVFSRVANPRAFECHFEVSILNDNVKIPEVLPDSIYDLGASDAVPLIEKSGLAGASKDAERPGSMTILVVAGDRGGSQRNQIQVPRELDAIQSAIRACKFRSAFSLAVPTLGATAAKLALAYREQASVLHFVGHGNDRSLSLIADGGVIVSQIPLLASSLADILNSFPYRVTLCVMNTCRSETIARELVERNASRAAIGWTAEIEDSAAITFAGTLYGCIGDGQGLRQSVALANAACGVNAVLHTDPEFAPDTQLLGEERSNA